MKSENVRYPGVFSSKFCVDPLLFREAFFQNISEPVAAASEEDVLAAVESADELQNLLMVNNLLMINKLLTVDIVSNAAPVCQPRVTA